MDDFAANRKHARAHDQAQNGGGRQELQGAYRAKSHRDARHADLKFRAAHRARAHVRFRFINHFPRELKDRNATRCKNEMVETRI